MSVKFLKNWRCYFEGDVATFPDTEERVLVRNGTAEPVTVPPRPDESEPELRPRHRQTTINSRL